jgi:hypothetical protein
LTEIAARDFMDNLTSLLKSPGLNIDVKNKILRYVQNWALAFEGRSNLSYVGTVYKELQSEGTALLSISFISLTVSSSHFSQASPSRPKTSQRPPPPWSTLRPHPSGPTRNGACAAVMLSHSRTGSITVATAARFMTRNAVPRRWRSRTLGSRRKSGCVTYVIRSSRRTGPNRKLCGSNRDIERVLTMESRQT